MNTNEYLLARIAEECVEAAQRALKAQAFGLDEVQEGHLLTNRERLVQELNDVYAVVEMLGLAEVDRPAMTKKKEKVLAFMGHAKKCGTLARVDVAGIWFAPADRLPDEGRELFFMTESSPWAGERVGDDWCDWGDKGIICHTEDVKLWQYAPEVV